MDQKTHNQLLLHPIYLLSQQIKQKSVKKSALQNISIIAIALGPKKTRKDLIPFLTKVFLRQNQQYRIIILKSLPNLLPLVGKNHHACSLLQLVIDILCIYSQKQIRKQAFVCLQKMLSWIDIRKAQKSLINTLKLLNREPGQNIRQLIIKIIPYIYIAVDIQNQKDLLTILKSFIQTQQDILLLSRQLPSIIKVMPPVPEAQIKSIVQLLIKNDNTKIKINLIEPIILLAKALGQQATFIYFQTLVKDANHHKQDKIMHNVQLGCNLIKKVKYFQENFSKEKLQILYEIVYNYKEQKQQIKNSILQNLEYFIPFLNQEKKLQLFQVPQSLQLKNTLGQTLSRMNQNETLMKIISASDNDFKIKMFPKLQKASYIHLSIFQSIMNAKNWRTKLTMIQNLQKRLQNNEEVEIFISKLSQHLGDKIAVVRNAVNSFIFKIISKKRLQFKAYRQILIKGLKSQNWFQRQNIYLMILETLQKCSKENINFQAKNIWDLIIQNNGLNQKVINILSIIDEIIEWYQLNEKQIIKPFRDALRLRSQKMIIS